jgi:hypothetical protein
MKIDLIGLESSSIMPLVAITPLTQECYETIWGNHLADSLIAHEDSISELKDIFKFRANTFYSNPITRLEKIKDFSPSEKMSLKGMALKLLLDGQMGGWIGNKNSRVQTFFFSDAIDAVDDGIKEPRVFSAELIRRMKRKIEMYNQLLTPAEGILTIDVRRILPYWGFHNVSSSIFSEARKIRIEILPDCESFAIFESLPPSIRRDAYHYHMLKKEKVALILVGDANYKKNVCSCKNCISHECEVKILTDKKRKKLLGLA